MPKRIIVLSILFPILAVVWLGAVEKIPPPETKDARNKMEKAEKAMKNKDRESALVLWRDVMAMEPNYAPAYFFAAVASRMEKDNDQALILLERALQVQPGFDAAIAEYTNLLNELALEMTAQNQPEKAGAYYARLAALPGLENIRKPVLIEACYNLGITAFQAKKYDQSAEAFRKMLAIPSVEKEAKKNYALAQYMMGVNLDLLDKPEEAIVYLRKYLGLADSDDAGNFIPLVSYLIAKHEYALLESEVGNLKNDPSVSDPKARARELAKARGTIPELLQNTLAGRPDIEEAYALLSNYHYYAGEHNRAIAVCKTLLEKFPDSGFLADYQKFLKKLEEEKSAREPQAAKK